MSQKKMRISSGGNKNLFTKSVKFSMLQNLHSECLSKYNENPFNCNSWNEYLSPPASQHVYPGLHCSLQLCTDNESIVIPIVNGCSVVTLSSYRICTFRISN